MDLDRLRSLRNVGRALRSNIDQALFHADERLAALNTSSARIQRPANTDWAWRPSIWRGPLDQIGIVAAETRTRFGHEAMLFHDCMRSELTLRQTRNTREEDLAPFGLNLDVFRFDGSFLSLVIDVPGEGLEDLTKSHIIQIDCMFDAERPIEVFARLNIKHGPNTEQMVREFPESSGRQMVEFDLAYSELNEKRIEKAWIDMIFEGAEMNQIGLRDLTVLRHFRAAL